MFKQPDPWAVVGSVVTGTLMANFIGPAAGHYIGGWFGDGGSAFIVGLSAMAIAQGLVYAVRARFRLPPDKTDKPT